MIEYDAPPTVHVYHRCADFAAGSVWPPSALVGPAYWWASYGSGSWQVRIRGVHDVDRAALESRIRSVARLEVNAIQAARAAQDARAEAPDV